MKILTFILISIIFTACSDKKTEQSGKTETNGEYAELAKQGKFPRCAGSYEVKKCEAQEREWANIKQPIEAEEKQKEQEQATQMANAKQPSDDEVRGNACEDYVKSISTEVNKYTGKKYATLRWSSIYKMNGMVKHPKFGPNYLLHFIITRMDENGFDVGDGVSYYCVSDLKTKAVIGFEPLPY